jgi:hypothetical protein
MQRIFDAHALASPAPISHNTSIMTGHTSVPQSSLVFGCMELAGLKSVLSALIWLNVKINLQYFFSAVNNFFNKKTQTG